MFDLSRSPEEGLDGFHGLGQVYVETFGKLQIRLDDQGSVTDVTCDFASNGTEPSAGGFFVEDGTMVVVTGHGMLDDLGRCTADGQAYEPPNIAAVGSTWDAVEGLLAGRLPARVAFAMGWVDAPEDWAGEDPEDHVDDLIESAYVEAEPKLGEQTVAFKRSYMPTKPGLTYRVCPDIGVTDTPATQESCDVESTTKITIKERSQSAPPLSSAPTSSAPTTSAPATSAPTTGAPAAEQKDSPGASVGALLAVALAAVALRRRG